MELPNAISFEIKMLANLIKRKLDDGVLDDGEEGLTGMQGWVIGYLRMNEDRDVYQRDLEKDFKIRRATVTGVLQLMERNGLINRKAVGHDARLKKIILTEKAILLNDRAYQKFKDFEGILRSGLEEEEVAAFFATAEKLKKNLV